MARMKMPGPSTDDALLEQFIAAFATLGDTVLFDDLDPAAVPLACGPADEQGYRHWRPRPLATSPVALSRLYARLPSKFPPLYEALVLTYRWAEVDLETISLLANPIGSDLSGLEHEIFKDDALVEVLLPNGLLQFAKVGGGNYDPICFDTRHRRNGGDTPILRVEHEEILCNHRLGETEEVAPTFRALVERVIATAAEVRSSRGLGTADV